MELYHGLLAELKELSDEKYREFHKRLLKNDAINVIGVRTPDLRKLAKKWAKQATVREIMSFPDEYYEVTFVKLTAVSNLKFDEFTTYVDDCVALIDNWATCDCFTPKCIIKHQTEFLPYIEKYLKTDAEFYQRFAFTTLLHYYVEEKYLNLIFNCLNGADTDYYYVHMAVAWLTAEILVKYYDAGKEFLKAGTLDKKTHNKAIQKATESFRLTDEQKNELKGMKK